MEMESRIKKAVEALLDWHEIDNVVWLSEEDLICFFRDEDEGCFVVALCDYKESEFPVHKQADLKLAIETGFIAAMLEDLLTSDSPMRADVIDFATHGDGAAVRWAKGVEHNGFRVF